MEVQRYQKSGERISVELPESFTIKVEPTLVKQIVVAEAANARSPHGHTKTRGEVRGGGKKPWRQKGTGRARASSSRSPIWVGGGITFGPRPERNFSKDVNRKMRQRAFAMAFSSKLAERTVTIIDESILAVTKTKQAAEVLSKIAPDARKVLLIVSQLTPELILPLRNLPNLSLATASSVSTTELLLAQVILPTEAAFQELATRAFGEDFSLKSSVAPVSKSAETKETK